MTKPKNIEVDINTLALLAARAAHAANRAYCVSLGDDSQVSWNDASEGIRQSALVGVASIIENPKVTPKQSHMLWCAFKKSEGWVWGEKKDEEKKTHPCLLSYGMISEDQQFKDHLFTAVVRAVLGIQ